MDRHKVVNYVFGMVGRKESRKEIVVFYSLSTMTVYIGASEGGGGI